MEPFPFWKQRMNPMSIRIHLPDRVGIGSGIGKIKSDLPAIRRIPNGKHEAVHLRQRMRFISVFVNEHYRAGSRVRVDNVSPIRCPICEECLNVSDTVWCSGRQGLYPKFKYGVWPYCGALSDQ